MKSQRTFLHPWLKLHSPNQALQVKPRIHSSMSHNGVFFILIKNFIVQIKPGISFIHESPKLLFPSSSKNFIVQIKPGFSFINDSQHTFLHPTQTSLSKSSLQDKPGIHSSMYPNILFIIIIIIQTPLFKSSQVFHSSMSPNINIIQNFIVQTKPGISFIHESQCNFLGAQQNFIHCPNQASYSFIRFQLTFLHSHQKTSLSK
jgi:hypothetical protein